VRKFIHHVEAEEAGQAVRPPHRRKFGARSTRGAPRISSAIVSAAAAAMHTQDDEKKEQAHKALQQAGGRSGRRRRQVS
jgi:hypothetical protein